MSKKYLAPALLFLLVSLGHAANEPIGFTLGAAIKSTSRVNIAADRSRVDLVAEGAGVITSQERTVHFYALCSVVDTLAGSKQIDGAGDCELKSTGTGMGYLHFHGAAEHADRGTITLQGGTGDFAGIEGSVAVEVSVNPPKVGKPVFFVESESAASAQR